MRVCLLLLFASGCSVGAPPPPKSESPAPRAEAPAPVEAPLPEEPAEPEVAPPSGGPTIHLSTPSGLVVSGRPVLLRIQITNPPDGQTVHWAPAALGGTITYTAILDDEIILRPDEAMRAISYIGSPVETLAAGGTETIQIPLHEHLDLTRPGEYVVSVVFRMGVVSEGQTEAEVLDEPRYERSVSGTVTFRVL